MSCVSTGVASLGRPGSSRTRCKQAYDYEGGASQDGPRRMIRGQRRYHRARVLYSLKTNDTQPFERRGWKRLRRPAGGNREAWTTCMVAASEL